MKLCPLCKRNWEDDFRVCPIDGLALEAVATPPEGHGGKSVGKLPIGEKIADGDLGPIYRAEDPARGPIAVQFLAADRVGSPVLREAIEDAVRLAAQLQHPHVVRTYSAETTEAGEIAILMEFVPGSNLSQYRRNNPGMDVKECCGIIKQVAEGLVAAHRMSLLHGSLHPTGILISPEQGAKVGGFHRSALRDVLERASAKPEDIPYWSPEQLGIIRDMPFPDYRTDVYSLGVILYELLTGRHPWEPKSIEEFAAVLDAAPPLPPNFSNSQVSPTLSRVVLKALAKQPVDRHASMEDFLRELSASMQPFREPEMPSSDFAQPAPHRAMRDDSLFPSSSPRKESVENLWPDAAPAPDSGESSMFGWFKTQFAQKKTHPKRSEAGFSTSSDRSGQDDSFFPRKSRVSEADDETNERTAIVSGARHKHRRLVDTVTGWRRDDDSTGTDALPRRRFSSRTYLMMGLGGVVLIGAVLALFLMFGRASTGKLTIESTPTGAQVYLNDEYRGNTPLLLPAIRADAYRVRLQLDGYESAVASVDVAAGSDVQKAFVLTKQFEIPRPPPEQPLAIPLPNEGTKTPPTSNPGTSFQPMFNAALRSRSFFPPTPGNAWDVLQSWQKDTSAAGPALDQAPQSFCREVEAAGMEKLNQRDFQYVRGMLEQIRNRLPGQNCAAGLQAGYDNALRRSVSDLRSLTAAAMNRQNYVTPDSDNALKYTKLILQIDPQDTEARTLERDLFTRAMDQARAKSDARHHQDALDIYTELKTSYPDPPGGTEPINQAIEREKRKATLLSALKVPYSVAVKHGHSFLRVKNRDCTGVLRADGFTIEFNGEHGFKLSYDLLKSVSYNKGKITLEGSAIREGKIELEQADKNPSPSLAELYAKIEEYRKMRAEYLH